MVTTGTPPASQGLAPDFGFVPGGATEMVPPRVLHRALPGWAIDLMREGVPGWDLKERGQRAVFSALFRTAASACQRGMPQSEWQAYVMEPRSRLSNQVRLRNGRTTLPDFKVQRLLNTAWDKATVWVEQQDPPATRRELLLRSRTDLTAALAKLEDPDSGLSSPDRNVLSYACAQIQVRAINQVTLPWRAVVAGTGLPERTVKNSLRRLQDNRHLILVRPGKAGANRRRANIYRLPAPPVPVNGSMGPPGKVYGTPGADAVGTPVPGVDDRGGS